MCYRLCFFAFLLSSCYAWGQLNMRLASQLQYDSNINDVWGYEAPDGTEYALVGKVDGVSIVSLADPENAVEVASIPGQYSIWRDLKTFGEYCYVTTDQANTTEGVTVIDLRHLPDSVSYYHWTDLVIGDDTLETCHNLYIDENGYGYLAGCNLNRGGMIYLDLFTTPGTPIFVDAGPAIYAHDVYVQDNRMYASELREGQMAIYDVSDKTNTVLLGTINTPFEFTHNIWVNEDASVAFTTDERANAPVTSYNIVDPEDIIELDQYRPAATLGEDVIPHNVHVKDNWLIISYYTDGGKIVDASRPDNLVEVGNFDTFFGPSGGFFGSWGAYPFFDSGLVLLTDITNGLFVLEPNYVRAAFLEGHVSDVTTDLPLAGTRVIINAEEEPNLKFSRLDGTYGTGLATAGSYTVNFAREGYERLDTSATITNGVVSTLDVQLKPLPKYTVRGVIRDQEDGSPIPNAVVQLSNDLSLFEARTDSEGVFVLEEVFKETYQLTVAAWGYQLTFFADDLMVAGEENWTFELARGYEDDFYFDLGWGTRAFGAERGRWTRGEPRGTSYQGSIANPNLDIETDFGDQCWVTGNNGGGAGADDVDDGMVRLFSPPMKLASRYERPIISYDSWFFNDGGFGTPPNDSLVVRLTNGTDTVTLETVQESRSEWRERRFFALDTIPITLTDDMRILFEASDYEPGHLVEAAVDVFRVEEGQLTNVQDLAAVELEYQFTPNPFREQLQLSYEFADWTGSAQLVIYTASGQAVYQQKLTQASGQVLLQPQLPAGVYWLSVEIPGHQVVVEKIVKQ
ncbi:MAG: choice-of-anchor B family protein [Bacteroidetes bacterium]|nr:MAG: choice-of-anchor B family protein [Bacteroidota bacterium]